MEYNFWDDRTHELADDDYCGVCNFCNKYTGIGKECYFDEEKMNEESME